jgi:ABC-type phosphate transport system ATPase subunit
MHVLGMRLHLRGHASHSSEVDDRLEGSAGPLLTPISLSSGQQQLLCLSRMLLSRQRRPRAVVLLDEITSELDPGSAATIHKVRHVV